MGIRGRHFTISTFKCTECGKEGIPLSRKQSNQRESGHLKKIYCVHCKKETNHVEIREFDYADQLLYSPETTVNLRREENVIRTHNKRD
jgi:hypothetical protein